MIEPTSGLALGLRSAKSDLIDDCDDEITLRQLGMARLAFDAAPPWPTFDDGSVPDAIIETFEVRGRELVAIGESDWLDAWQPRAQAFLDTVLAQLDACGVEVDAPGYLTCSITPVEQLTGDPHFDDADFVPADGVGVVAITGQFLGPRVADGHLVLGNDARPGPIVVAGVVFEAFRSAPPPAGAADEICLLAGFGQLHAGPAADQLPPGELRQLMVLRVPTRPHQPTGRGRS